MAPPGPSAEKATKGIPDRWLHCPKTGNVIMNVFFPFKTPLCNLYDKQIAERKYQFHVDEVFKHPYVSGRKIGLWIDLTKTDRYYYTDEVTGKSCIYKKLPLAGHGSSPTVEETKVFIDLVSNFRQSNPNDIVAVHCTHGFNRTGFLIAAYLFSVEGWQIDAAISEFASNRDKGIYKQDYINDLFDRYGDPEDDVIQAPPRPTWDNGGDAEENGGISNVSSNGEHREDRGVGGQRPSSSQNANNNGKQFMDGLVMGVTFLDDSGLKNQLRAKIKQLCHYNRDGFPGLQPVSLSHQNIKLLQTELFQVSWKADGMRYMVYIYDKNEVYAFDRDNEIFLIQNLDFPSKKGVHLKNTLVDAEMIIDKVKVGERIVDTPRLLIYDIIHFGDFNMMKEDFKLRAECIRNEIIKPRNDAIGTGKINKETQPMSVRIKDFWDLVAVPKLFEPKFVANVGHEIDGLIFQPVNRPYVPGRCDYVLKWKPPSHNSVDFLLRIQKIHKEGMLPEWQGLLFVQHMKEPFGMMKATNFLKQYDNKIIECTLEVDARGAPKEWKFMRERTDKSAPNALRTAQNVLDTMTNPVTKEVLCRFVAERCARWRPDQQPPAKRPKN